MQPVEYMYTHGSVRFSSIGQRSYSGYSAMNSIHMCCTNFYKKIWIFSKGSHVNYCQVIKEKPKGFSVLYDFLEEKNGLFFEIRTYFQRKF